VVSRTGAGVLVFIFVAGLWLVVAPFALRFQHAHAGWGGATRTDVITGGILAVSAFAGMFGVLAGRVREMYADVASVTGLPGSTDFAHRE
jgi:hypothetical protein